MRSPKEIDLRVQYGADSLVILEFDGSKRYEVVRWNADDIERDPHVREAADHAKGLVETGQTEELLKVIYGGIEQWMDARQDRRID